MGLYNKWKVVDGKLYISWYDEHTRKIGIMFFSQIKGLEFKSGGKKTIDLELISNKLFGAEGESDGWDGDYWEHYKSNKFEKGWKSLNIPHRKFHYWNIQHLSTKHKAKKYWGEIDQGGDENFYFRINVRGDQLILVYPKTIHDREKSPFFPDEKVANSSEYEDWICVRQEFTETWNLQPNGVWELNGKYHGPTPEECPKIEKDRKNLIKKLVREYELKRLKDIKNNK